MALPLASPRPDCERFAAAMRGDIAPSRPPLVEYLVDETLMRPIVQDMLGLQWAAQSDGEGTRRFLDNFTAFWHRLGYDFVRFEVGLPFASARLSSADTAPGAFRQRQWADQHHGTITTWADYDRYPWPRIEEFDFGPFEYLDAHLPEGMGLIASHGGGPYEHLSSLMSYEGLCLALHDQPDLVRAVADRVGSLMLAFYKHIVDLDRLIALFPGDDMGFRSATLIAPDDLRALTLPWHGQFARLAQERGRLYLLHSCGNILQLMPDLIAAVGIDGRHSFEDAIMPIDEFQRLYGTEVAVLGGVDVDILARGSVDDVRRRTRQLIETCGARGRFAIGSGNSIPSYIPLPNYLAMLDEALR